MFDGSFHVISTNATFPKEMIPFRISDDYIITIPNELETKTFDKHLKDAGYFSRMFVPFGSEKKIIDYAGQLRTSWEHAEKHDIYILKSRNFNRHMNEMNYAGSLLNPKLRFVMHSMYVDETESLIGAFVPLSYSDLTLMTEGSYQDRIEYSQEQLLEFKELFLMIKTLDVESRYKGVLQLFHETDDIPNTSNLLTLSYFSILEALLTNGRSNGESITNQLIYKSKLLLNMSGMISYQHLFHNINYDNLWKKLYKLRSNIAHGNKFDFQNELSPLKNINTVNIYLDMVVQQLLKFSLNHQQLVDDLKSC